MTAISGCATTTPPRPTETNRFNFEVSQQVCNVDALAEEKQTSLAVSNDTRQSIQAYQNKYGAYDETTGTVLSQKLAVYEAELEASYRFVTQNCGAYMRCLEQNQHNESMCWRIETRWNESQSRFATLARDIRVIAAQVEMKRIEAESRKKRRRGHKGHDRCTTINSIFTDCRG